MCRVLTVSARDQAAACMGGKVLATPVQLYVQYKERKSLVGTSSNVQQFTWWVQKADTMHSVLRTFVAKA